MLPSFAMPRRRRATVQYFEMFGNRGIYHQGWTAVTKHRTPWKADSPPPFDDDGWELYGPDDWTQAHDLAAENPAKLAELQRLWLIEAVKYNVVPLDDRGFERINPDIAGRPQLIRGNTQLLFRGMRVSENGRGDLKNKSHSVTAEHRRARVRRQRRHHHPGRQRRRLVAVRARRASSSTASTSSASSTTSQGGQADPGGQASGADGVRLRRRRPGQGR